MPTTLPRSTCAREGIDETGVLGLIDGWEAAKVEIHSLMIVRHSRVVAEGWWYPYRAETPHLLYSLTKSFTSTAIGFAVSEGRFGLDDSLVELFPEQAPAEPSPNLAKMTVRHLLTMSVGHDVEPTLGVGDGTWESCASAFLSHPVPHVPGEHFLYNTAASNMLSILVQRFSGEPLDTFLRRRLLGQVGIEGERWTRGADFVWGGSGLYAKTEDIAKLGHLYLNKGVWDGKQLLPAGWAEMATARQVSNGSEPDNDWNQGYGFQFWRCRHSAYRGDGAFGQFCVVLPEHDAVVAITSGEDNMQAVLNEVWTHLLPSFDKPVEEPGLSQKLESLVLGPSKKSAVPAREIEFSDAEGLEVRTKGEDVSLTWGSRIDLRLDEWAPVEFDFKRAEAKTCAARACWNSASELVIKVVDLTAPHFVQFTVRTDADSIDVEVADRAII